MLCACYERIQAVILLTLIQQCHFVDNTKDSAKIAVPLRGEVKIHNSQNAAAYNSYV